MTEIVDVTNFKSCAIRICEDFREFNILNGRELNLKTYVKKHQEQNTKLCYKQLLYVRTKNVCQELHEFENLKFLETSDEKIYRNFVKPNIGGLFWIRGEPQLEDNSMLANVEDETTRFFVQGTRQSIFFDFISMSIFDKHSTWIWRRNAMNSATLKYEEKSYYSDQIEFLNINFYGKCESVESIQLDENNFSYWHLYPNIKLIHLIESSLKKTTLDPNVVRMYRNLQVILKSGMYSDSWMDILKGNPRLKLILFYNKNFKNFESILIKHREHIDEYVNQGFGLEYRFHKLDMNDCSVEQHMSSPAEVNETDANQSAGRPSSNQTESELNAKILHQNIIALRERLKKNDK